MKNNSIRQYLAVAAVVAMVGTAPAMAGSEDGEPGPDAASFIEHFDQDGDGVVSASEFPGDESMFNSLDADESGYIDETEAPQGRPPHGGPDSETILTKFDTDGDGLLSADEFPGPEDHFDRLDADGDMYLSTDELMADRPGPGPSGKDRFTNDDMDQDGLVSQAEFSGPEDLFDRLDTDGDGYISKAEARPSPPHGGPAPFADGGTDQ